MIKNLISFFNGKSIKKYIFFAAILYFLFYTITELLIHPIFFDEANAWSIAAYMDFFDLFKLMKFEGHLFVWYTLLMPFAKNDLFYPYSMQMMNWIFAFGAILVMWRYAPFNSYAKAFITLSLPFLKIYPILARCYSIGIFLLFIIAVTYPKRLCHPIIYSILIVFLANTSVMALIGATALGILFLYDLYKSRVHANICNKTLALSLIILIVGGGAVLLQLFGFSEPYYTVNNELFSYKTHFLSFYFPKSYDVFHVSFAILYSFLLISAVKFFKNDLKPFFFIFFTHSTLIYIFINIYAGECWHYCFIFLYFIMSIWMYMSEYKLTMKFQKVYIYLFTLFCFLLIIYPSDYARFIGNSVGLKNYFIEHIDNFSSAKIFFFPTCSLAKEILPYLEKYKLDFYDSYGNPIRSFESYKIQYRDLDMDYAAIEGKLKNGEVAYILMSTNGKNRFLELLKNTTNYNNLLFVNIKSIFPYYIFSVTKKQ